MISKTAVHVAISRAIGAREPDRTVRNPDFLAERILRFIFRDQLDADFLRPLSLDYEEAMKDPEVARNVCAMLVRTRFVDDALLSASRSGIAQIAVIGAGLDTRAYRFSDAIRHTRIFEVDRSEMLSVKRDCVDSVLGNVPSNLTYSAVRLGEGDGIGAIADHGFDMAQRTLFVLEGVTVYLGEETVEDILAFVARCARGSRVLLDFVSREFVDALGVVVRNGAMSRYPAMPGFLQLIRDEPWIFGVPAGCEREFLAAYGIEIRQSLEAAGDRARRTYLTRVDGTIVAQSSWCRMEEPPHSRISDSRLKTRNRLFSPCLIDAVVAGARRC